MEKQAETNALMEKEFDSSLSRLKDCFIKEGIKDLRMNLTKKMKEVCTEKDKMVLKETKEDMNNKKKKERYSMLGETPGKRNLTGYTVHSITKNQLSN